MTNRPDLRQVLEHYHVEIRSERRELQILCPIHDESRPSCSVNFDKGVIHCQSCGFGGDSYSVIRLKEGLTDAPFAEVVSAAERILGGSFQADAQQPRRGHRRERGAVGYRPKFKRGRVLS